MNKNPIISFAEAHYEIGADSSISGPFKLANSPWLRGPFEALADPETRMVTAQFAAQLGKNLSAEIWGAYIISRDPGNMLIYGQTDDDASIFFNDRFLKRIEGMDILRPLWPDGRGVWKKDGLFLPHMYCLPLGANPSNTQGKSARYVLCDELHLWHKGLHQNAIDRTTSFWDAKIYNITTGGDAGSEAAIAYESGTQEVWFFGCIECEKKFKLRMSPPSEAERVIVWETKPDKSGEVDFLHIKKSARIQCPHCGAQWEDTRRNRERMNELAEFVPQNKNGSKLNRSFQIPQLAAPWVPLEAIVEKWVRANEAARQGNVSLLENFVKKQLGETWENRFELKITQNISGGYALPTEDEPFEWEDEYLRFMAVDVQEKRGRHFWWVVRASDAKGVTKLINAGKADSWEEVETIRKTYTVLPKYTICDARFANLEVAQNCVKNGYIWMQAEDGRACYEHAQPDGNKVLKPYSTLKEIDPLSGLRKQRAGKKAIGVRFIKNWARNLAYNRINGLSVEWGLPTDVEALTFVGTNERDSSYIKQINSWKPVDETNRKTGEVYQYWKMVHKDDHLMACEEMILIAMAMKRLIIAEISE